MIESCRGPNTVGAASSPEVLLRGSALTSRSALPPRPCWGNGSLRSALFPPTRSRSQGLVCAMIESCRGPNTVGAASSPEVLLRGSALTSRSALPPRPCWGNGSLRSAIFPPTRSRSQGLVCAMIESCRGPNTVGAASSPEVLLRGSALTSRSALPPRPCWGNGSLRSALFPPTRSRSQGLVLRNDERCRGLKRRDQLPAASRCTCVRRSSLRALA